MHATRKSSDPRLTIMAHSWLFIHSHGFFMAFYPGFFYHTKPGWSPRFSIFANLCRSAGFCKDRCTESWRSIQICKIFTEVCRFLQKYVFLQLLRNQYTIFLDFFNYFFEYFSWPRVSWLKFSITQNSREGKFVPITIILVTGESAVSVIHRNLSISLEHSRTGFFNFERRVYHIDFVLTDKIWHLATF